MRSLSKAALGGGIVSVATVGGLIVGGVFATSATLVVADPFAPKAGADSLTKFDSCGALLRWYVDHGVKEVGPYGWNGYGWGGVDYAFDSVERSAQPLDAAAPAAGMKSTSEAQSSSTTGTNTQEADVDEPDVAKTDGRRVVRLIDQRVLVISDVTGKEPRELGRISLPIDVYGGELLLAGDHVLISQAGGVRGGGPMPLAGVTDDMATTSRAMPWAGGGTRVIDVDISDVAHPRIAHDDTYTGSEISMRLYGDVVRVVTSTPRPQLAWVMPGQQGRPGHQKPTEAEATRHNRALVRATSIEDWLPGIIDNRGADHKVTPLLDCTDVYHPAEWSGGETTTVTTYDVGDPAGQTSVGVTADGQIVYSSADRLYVASTRYDAPVWPERDRISSPIMPRRQDIETRLHAFALDGDKTTYLGSGHVDGTVRDRWSLDEHDGKLRVAWTRDGTGSITDSNGETRQHTRNGITIFSERNGALVPTGTIAGLGVDENIQSVRWFDDLAVLVTFRQMDPLYTIDLSDQDHPREVGALKIPGYSGYLHPIGDDLLLGLGVDANSQGQNLGSQAAVFDIRDLSDPRRVSQQGFGQQSSLPALDDPRGFTWLPGGRTGLTTVSSWTSERTRLIALHVSQSGQLEARDLATDVGWNARTLPLDDGRVALVDEHLRILDLT